MDLDPLSSPALVATISALLAATAGEAGRTVWESLVGLVRRSFGSGSPPERIVGGSPDADAVETLADALASRAAADPAFAEALLTWSSRASAAAQDLGGVVNQIGGDATIRGNVVQARDISGPITFGN